MADIHRERRRFWSRVRQADDGCWIWVGGTRSNGYGSFAVRTPDGRWTQTTAHRWAYRNLVDVIPDGFEVDHLCCARGCVRPDHLEAVALAENRRRRDCAYSPGVDRSPRPLPVIPSAPARPPRRDPTTHCSNGHAYAEVGWVANGSSRTCRGCRDVRQAKRRRGGAHGTETHCPQGHPYSGDNLYLRPQGGRECRTCVLARNRAAYHTRKANA